MATDWTHEHQSNNATKFPAATKRRVRHDVAADAKRCLIINSLPSKIVEPQPSILSIDNLRRVIALRYIVIIGQIVALVAASRVAAWPIQVAPVLFVLGMLALLNLFTQTRLRHLPMVSNFQLFAQLLADVAALTLVLYFTGGSANPFVSLYLLPLVVAATLLPAVYTWSMATGAVTAYTVLMFYHVPLAPHHAPPDNIFGVHILGMWFTFVLSAGLISHFAVRMARSLGERDRLLASAREEALRNERIVALGTIAAGAAHELGTPLNTMALLAEELTHCCEGNSTAANGVAELNAQIGNCKHIISGLLASAGQTRSEGGSIRSLVAYLEDLTAKWRLMRPPAALQSRFIGDLSAAHILSEPTLNQAFINLLNNAADASPQAQAVELEARREADVAIVEICDRGPGLTPEAMRSAGEPFFTTKSSAAGLGLGLFLSHAAVERFGGSVQLLNRDGGGACAHVRLPLFLER